MTDDESAIRTLVKTWMEASQNGNFETVLTLMTDDVVFMTPGKEPFGKAELSATSAAIKDVNLEGKNEIVELKVLGDWAYARTHIEIAMTPPGGAKVEREGYTLPLFRKAPDGQWRIARDANCWRRNPFDGAYAPVASAGIRGCSSMVEQELPKLTTRVRFPSPAPKLPTSAQVVCKLG